jgi:RES domain-containing protein
MALVWRLVPPQFATTLNGKGNVERGARWNSPGRGVVYASFNLSLCILETFVQMPSDLRTNLPKEMSAVRIEIPDTPRRDVYSSEWPHDSSDDAIARRCRVIGDAWLAHAQDLVLTAPSFVVPQERNVMINPAHPLMNRVRIDSVEPFRFDPRLAAPR